MTPHLSGRRDARYCFYFYLSSITFLALLPGVVGRLWVYDGSHRALFHLHIIHPSVLFEVHCRFTTLKKIETMK